jgi:hypothetical protein
VDNCAAAIRQAGLTPGIEGQAFNVIDDDLPTAAALLRRLHGRGQKPRTIPVPGWSISPLTGLYEWYSRASGGQLPPVLSRYRSDSLWKPLQYPNDKAKAQLGWLPHVPFAEAFERSLPAMTN